MSVENANSIHGDIPRSLLPECNWKKQEMANCWRRVVTDKGVCFSNDMQGKLIMKATKFPLTCSFPASGDLVTGLGPQNGYGFVYDIPESALIGPRFSKMWEPSETHYGRILVMPQNQFVLGKFATNQVPVRDRRSKSIYTQDFL